MTRKRPPRTQKTIEAGVLYGCGRRDAASRTVEISFSQIKRLRHPARPAVYCCSRHEDTEYFGWTVWSVCQSSVGLNEQTQGAETMTNDRPERGGRASSSWAGSGHIHQGAGGRTRALRLRGRRRPI